MEHLIKFLDEKIQSLNVTKVILEAKVDFIEKQTSSRKVDQIVSTLEEEWDEVNDTIDCLIDIRDTVESGRELDVMHRSVLQSVFS